MLEGGQELKTETVTFLRVELNAPDVATMDGRSKMNAVVAFHQNVALVLADRIVAVDKIKTGGLL